MLPREFIEAEKSRTKIVDRLRRISMMARSSGRPGRRGETWMFDVLPCSIASRKTVAVRLPVTSSKYLMAPAAIVSDGEGSSESVVEKIDGTREKRAEVTYVELQTHFINRLNN